MSPSGRDNDRRSPSTRSKREEMEQLHKKGISPGSQVPPDTVVVRSFDDWVLYYSVGERAFYFKTLDYHPAPLKLPLNDLFSMLADIENIIAGQKGEGG